MNPVPSSTEFTVPGFIRYFQNHDTLEIPQDQPLIVRGISILRDDSLISEREQMVPEIAEKIVFITLNKMVQPLARVLKLIIGVKDCSVEYKIDEDFKVKFSQPCKLQLARESIYTCLSDLFRLMVVSSIPQVVFAPHQPLIVYGLTNEEFNPKKPIDAADIISKVISQRRSLGFRIDISGKDISVDLGLRSSGSSSPFKSLTLNASEELKLTLTDTYTFRSIKEFRNRLAIMGEITVPAGEVLKIYGSYIGWLWEEYDNRLHNIYAGPGLFILDQILLPLGKTVVLEQGSKETLCGWNGKYFEIKNHEGLTIKMTNGPLVTNMHTLGRLMIEDHSSHLTLEPNQKLVVYDVSEDVFKAIEGKVTRLGFVDLLAKRNPTGFMWSLEAAPLQINYSSRLGKAGELILSSPNKIYLSLKRAHSEQIVLNLLDNCSPVLLQRLQEADGEALMFVLCKVLFYYCCDDFRHYRTHELPDFFQEKTQAAILKLIKADEQFEKALNTLADDEGFDHLESILRSTPEEFDRLELDKLSPAEREIVTKIKNIAYEELQGSSYFMRKCLQNVITYLNQQEEKKTADRGESQQPA